MRRVSVQAAIGLLGLSTFAAGCDTDYPFPPVFCDDWCRATMRAGCEGDKPDECVSECLASTRVDCLREKDELRRCYDAAPDAAFVCAGTQDESAKSEPRAGVCAAEDSRLFACKEPVFFACLTSCAEGVERARLGDAPEPGRSFVCEDLAFDCECACFTVYLLGGEAGPSFFDCVESAATDTCWREAAAPPVPVAGESCKPLGVFAACTLLQTEQ